MEEERRRQKKPGAFGRGTASNEMCTFLIVNISSLQLIPINMIAYRSQYGSVSPSAIVGPAPGGDGGEHSDRGGVLSSETEEVRRS